MQIHIHNGHNIEAPQPATLDQAVNGAAKRVTHLIEYPLGLLEHQASYRTDSHQVNLPNQGS